MAIKWKGPWEGKCEYFEITGKLFRRIRCVNRNNCDEFKEKGRCEKEEGLDISQLTPCYDPKDSEDNIYLFNKNLLDFGQYSSFEEIRDTFCLEEVSIYGKKYWETAKNVFLKMLLENRNLIFVIYGHISGDVARQHRLIFRDFSVDDWLEIMSCNPEFISDYNELGIRFPDEDMVRLMCVFPDLDPVAYEEMKARMSGDLWVTLLSSGVSGGREKFWDDCPFERFSADNWINILRNRDPEVSAAARNRVKREYGQNFSDNDWSKLQRAGLARHFDHPGVWHFDEFYSKAPKSAAAAQAKSMFMVLAAGTALVFSGGVICTGNYRFFSFGAILTSVLCIMIWAAGVSRAISVRHNSNKGMFINTGIFSLFGGWVLAHCLLLLFGFLNVENMIMIIAGTFAFVGIMVAVIFGCDKIHRVVTFVLLGLMCVGYGLMCANAPQRGHVVICEKLNLKAAEKYYLTALLKKYDYANSWRKACESGDQEQIYKLSYIWNPDPLGGKIHDECSKQLIDAMLEKYEELKTIYAKLRLKESGFTQNYFADRILKENNLERKYRFARIYYEIYGQSGTNSSKLKLHLSSFAKNVPLTGQNYPLMFKLRLYDVISAYCTPEESQIFFSRIKAQLMENMQYPFSLDEIKILAKYPALQREEDRELWCNIMISNAVGVYYYKAMEHLEQLAQTGNFPGDFIGSIRQKYQETWKKRADQIFNKFLKSLDFNIMNNLCSSDGDNPQLVQYLRNERKEEFSFWAGWSYYKQNDRKNAWEYLQTALNVIINPDKAPGEIRQRVDNQLREYMAELATENGRRETALAVWKACYKNSKTQKYWQNILQCSVDDNEKISYLLDSPANVDLKLFQKYVELPFKKLSDSNLSEGEAIKMLDLISTMYGGQISNMPQDKRQAFDEIVIRRRNKKYGKTLLVYYMKNGQFDQVDRFAFLKRDEVAAAVSNSGFTAREQGVIFYGIAMRGKNFDTLFTDLFNKRFSSERPSPFEKVFPMNSDAYYFLSRAITKSHPQAMVIYAAYLSWRVANSNDSQDVGRMNEFMERCRKAAGNDEDLRRKIDRLGSI